MDCEHCNRARKQLAMGAPVVEPGNYPADEIRACPCPCHDTWKRWVNQ